MGLYKRCKHRGRQRDRCPCPWWGSFRGDRVSLSKWANQEVDSKDEARAILDEDAKRRSGRGRSTRRGGSSRRLRRRRWGSAKFAGKYFEAGSRRTLGRRDDAKSARQDHRVLRGTPDQGHHGIRRRGLPGQPPTPGPLPPGTQGGPCSPAVNDQSLAGAVGEDVFLGCRKGLPGTEPVREAGHPKITRGAMPGERSRIPPADRRRTGPTSPGRESDALDPDPGRRADRNAAGRNAVVDLGGPGSPAGLDPPEGPEHEGAKGAVHPDQSRTFRRSSTRFDWTRTGSGRPWTSACSATRSANRLGASLPPGRTRRNGRD